MATRDLYTIGRDTSPWTNRFEKQIDGIGDPASGLNRQFGWAMFIVPDESTVPSATRCLFYIKDTNEISCMIKDVGGKATIDILIDGSASGYGTGEAQYDISSVYQQGQPLFLYVQYNAYASTDADKVKLRVNDNWVTLNFVQSPIPSQSLDLGYATGAGTLSYGEYSTTYGFVGRMGQIRFFHGDRVAQDNPGLPSASAIDTLYYYGLGEPNSVAGQSGFDGLRAEWLLTEQSGSYAYDTSGFNFTAAVGSGIGWGGKLTITVSLQPKVDSVSVVNKNTIDVIFSKDMLQDSTFLNPSSYTLTHGYSVTAVSAPNTTTARLTITPDQHTGDSVTVTVSSSLQAADGQTMDTNHLSTTFTAAGSHPDISSIKADSQIIRVWFTEAVRNDSNLTDKTNYTITKVTSGAVDVTVLKVTPEPDLTYPRYVDLTVSDMTAGATYTLTVTGVMNAVGNLIVG